MWFGGRWDGGRLTAGPEVTVAVTVVVAALLVIKHAQALETREGLTVEPTVQALA